MHITSSVKTAITFTSNSCIIFCRCSKVFCAKHRHPELHDCDFDYKEEGRKLLEKENPIVKFSKLPKI